jgi:thiol-disulfide isomerase/thioredoxin
MFQRFIFFIWSFLFYTSTSQGQENLFSELNIGAKMPDIEISNIINYRKEKIKISEFRGKLLILDFWSLSCKGCIESFPKYAKIRDRFSEKLEILPIAFGSTKENVIKFYQNRKALGKAIDFPSAIYANTRQNLFYNLFPSIETGFPILIWIDTSGILRGITRSAELNEKNISKVFSGQATSLQEIYFQKDFSYEKPFLVDGNGGADTAFSCRSIISGFSDSINGNRYIKKRDEQFTRIFMPNEFISTVIQECAYRGNNKDLLKKKLLLEVKEPWIFNENPALSSSENKKNRYCFEVILPSKYSFEEAYKIMLVNLQTYFRISVLYESKEMSCLIIRNFNKKLSTSNDPREYNIGDNGLRLKLTNMNIKSLVSFLDKPGYPIIIDETNFETNIDIDVTIPRDYNFSQLKSLFEKYGIDVREEKRFIKTLVVRDSNDAVVEF